MPTAPAFSTGAVFFGAVQSARWSGNRPPAHDRGFAIALVSPGNVDFHSLPMRLAQKRAPRRGKENASDEGARFRMTAGRNSADFPDGFGARRRSGERDQKPPSGVVLARDGFEHDAIEIRYGALIHSAEIARGAMRSPVRTSVRRHFRKTGPLSTTVNWTLTAIDIDCVLTISVQYDAICLRDETTIEPVRCTGNDVLWRIKHSQIWRPSRFVRRTGVRPGGTQRPHGCKV